LEKEKSMKYMKGSVLLALLLLLGFGGVAEAQECVAGVGSANARAEGETEMIGKITVKCRGLSARDENDALTLGTSAPTKLEIEVTLNTDITNDRSSSDMIMSMATAPGYEDGMVMITAGTLTVNQVLATGGEIDLNGADDADAADDPLSGGAVSDDLRTVKWTVRDTDGDAANGNDGLTLFNIGANPGGTGTTDTDLNGFELAITGLRADASGVGHGNNITATVKVNGSTVGSADMTAAAVANGLDPVVKAAKGRECDDADGISARVTIREGNKNSFNQMDSFLLTFRNIPEGVTVMVPVTVGLEEDQSGTNIDETDGSFIVNLVEGRAGDGVGKPEGGMAMVELSATGTGEIRYEIGMTAPNDGPDATAGTADDVPAMATVGTSFSGQEWAHVPVYFSWDGGSVTMNADAMVHVSFYPSGGDTTPRFVGDADPDGVLTVEDCITMLTFPFVTSRTGYDTGIVVSNTADASGSCTATYSGSEDTESSPVVEGNSHWIFLVSTHMQDYSGRLMVECDFGGIDGYAQINDHMGNANGYLPRMPH
jgi:hypothetical protein